MQTTLPTSIPGRLIAGDTWQWAECHPSYLVADGWVLTYRIAGPSILQWDPAWVEADGEIRVITVPASATANLQPGTYLVVAQFSLGDERRSEERPATEVRADPATLSGGDAVHRVETELAQVNAAIDAMLAGRAVQYYQIGSRQVGNTPLKDLVALRDQLEVKLAAIKRRARGGRDGGFGVPVRHRFRDATA